MLLISLEYRSLSSTVSPPQITQYDQLGHRIDRLDTSEGWRTLKDIAIKEGIVAIPHERKQQEFSRIYGFAKVFIFSGDSHVVSSISLCSSTQRNENKNDPPCSRSSVRWQ